MKAATPSVLARAVDKAEVERWAVEALGLWRASWWKMAVLALLAGAVVHTFAVELQPFALLVLGPPLVWVLVVTACPALGPRADGSAGPLPNWVPGAIRTMRLGLVVGGIASTVFIGTALVVTAVLIALGAHPRSWAGAGGVSSHVPAVLVPVWRACGAGLMLILLGVVSLWYVRWFGLFFSATRGGTVKAARVCGRDAWSLNQSAIVSTLRVRWGAVASAAVAVLGALSGWADPLLLPVATFLPCLMAAAFRSVFLADAVDGQEVPA